VAAGQWNFTLEDRRQTRPLTRVYV
jgi:hypothetical protein